jgi:hypothetical protein
MLLEQIVASLCLSTEESGVSPVESRNVLRSLGLTAMH